jgi:hypothetical protein
MEIRDESDNLCSKIVINKWEIAIENYNCDEISIALGVLSLPIYFNIIKGNGKMAKIILAILDILIVVLMISTDFLDYNHFNSSLIFIIFISLIIFYTIFIIYFKHRIKRDLKVKNKT